MAPALRHATRSSHCSRRCLHSSARLQGSPFFALTALSNSRETQHLNKLSKLSRVDHSPTLELIKSSEVLPFASPPPPTPQTLDTPALTKAVPAQAKPAAIKASMQEAELLSVGRAILAQKDAEIVKLKRVLESQEARWLRKEQSFLASKVRAVEQIDDLAARLHSSRFWRNIFALLLGGAATAVYVQYSEDGPVKKALNASTIRLSPSQVKAQRVAPAAAPAPVPVAAAPAQPAKMQQPVVSPVIAEPLPTTQAKSSSWPSIFWVRS